MCHSPAWTGWMAHSHRSVRPNPLIACNRPGGADPLTAGRWVLRSVAVPTGRRDRASATLTLVALMLGAIVAGTATVAAQPRMIAGFAAAGLAGAAAASTETPVAGAQAA